MIAFEPNSDLFDLLARSLRANGLERAGFAEAYNVALSDQAGEAVLRVPDTDPSAGTLSGPALGESADLVSESPVRTVLLDSFGIEPAERLILKLTAGGFEHQVLRGAEQTIGRSDDVVILTGLRPEQIARHIPLPEYGRYLAELGFSAYVPSRGGATFEEIGLDALGVTTLGDDRADPGQADRDALRLRRSLVLSKRRLSEDGEIEPEIEPLALPDPLAVNTPISAAG